MEMAGRPLAEVDHGVQKLVAGVSVGDEQGNCGLESTKIVDTQLIIVKDGFSKEVDTTAGQEGESIFGDRPSVGELEGRGRVCEDFVGIVDQSFADLSWYRRNFGRGVWGC